MFYLKQSTASQKVTVKLVDNVDGYTPETSITTPTITLSKAGAAFGAVNDGTWTELANGLYTVTLNATDSETLSDITIHIEKTGCRNYEEKGYVLPANIYDSWFGSDKQQVDLTQVNGAAQTATLDTLKAETVLIVEDTNELQGNQGSWATSAVCTEARLAELDAANIPTDIDFIKNIQEGDWSIDTTATPWQWVCKIKGTATELIRKDAKDKDGNNITSISQLIGQITEPAE